MCKWCCALASGISIQITRGKSTTQRTFKCLDTRLLNNALAHYCLFSQMTQMNKDCDTYNEYICIYAFMKLAVNLKETVCQIQDDVYDVHDVSNRGDIGM